MYARLALCLPVLEDACLLDNSAGEVVNCTTVAQKFDSLVLTRVSVFVCHGNLTQCKIGSTQAQLSPQFVV